MRLNGHVPLATPPLCIAEAQCYTQPREPGFFNRGTSCSLSSNRNELLPYRLVPSLDHRPLNARSGMPSGQILSDGINVQWRGFGQVWLSVIGIINAREISI